MTGQVGNRSKKYKEEANGIANAKPQKFKQLHNRSNTMLSHNRNSYQAFLDFSDNFMKLVTVVKFQRHSIIFLQKAKVLFTNIRCFQINIAAFNNLTLNIIYTYIEPL